MAARCCPCACTTQSMEKIVGRASMQEQRSSRAHGNCEPCEICLVTPLSIQIGGGF